METERCGSSPQVASTKRCLSAELQESPTAKRAKRVKHGKRRRDRERNSGRESDGYVEQRDWVSFDASPATGSPIARLQNPIMPPSPFPLERAHKAQVLMTAENGKEEEPMSKANTRKTRAGPDANGEPKRPIDSGGFEMPAVAGPSSLKANKKKPLEEQKEPTPLSDFTPRVDYTFKAFPNPAIADFSTAKEGPKKESKKESREKQKKESHKESKEQPKNADSCPAVTTTVTEIDTIPAETLASSTGTKTLKAINKHLRALETRLTAVHPAYAAEESQALRADVALLHERLDRDELRASVRHKMLFNALVKISTDIGALHNQVQHQQDDHHVSDGAEGGQINDTAAAANGSTGNPRVNTASTAKESKDRLNRNVMMQSRKTLEQCLRSYTEDMDRAGNAEEVAKYGGLCVQYAGDLFKTLG